MKKAKNVKSTDFYTDAKKPEKKSAAKHTSSTNWTVPEIAPRKCW